MISQLFARIFARFRLVRQALLVPLTNPQLQLAPGVIVDLTSNKVTITQPLHLHCTERLEITSDKDLILESGFRTPNPDRRGYNYGIFENCPRDENGDPIITTNVVREIPCECSNCQA